MLLTKILSIFLYTHQNGFPPLILICSTLRPMGDGHIFGNPNICGPVLVGIVAPGRSGGPSSSGVSHH
jgi:hypothetical protein